MQIMNAQNNTMPLCYYASLCTKMAR